MKRPRSTSVRLHGPMTIFLTCVLAGVTFGQAPRVLEKDQVPNDKRLGDLKTLKGHFPFKVPDNPAAWYARAEKLRSRVLVATGLLPMPEKTPLNPVIHGKVQRDGFTVERVYFQSLPGHYVTGLLFRPSEESKTPHPGVLSPHGHGGRLQVHSEKELKRQLGNGAEHFADSGSMPKIARCAQLARMGCVTFIFDMLGYADSTQISHTVGHRHAETRPEESNSQNGWTLYSIQADLRLQSVMGLQTWNAIRALDFLAELPDVDPNRLAVTGGSGGGTQSILLGAIDNRIKVSFPNGMVSTSMQGGCYCENCNFLRVGTGNVELAALFAPKPQAMTAANDWTKDMMKDGYPELRWLYAMLGDEEDVYCRPMLHFRHNYNYVTRATMYQWMNRHLELGLDDPIVERDFPKLTAEEMAVWNDEHPAPTDTGPDHERKVCRWLSAQAQRTIHSKPKTETEALQKMGLFRVALPVVFGMDLDQPIAPRHEVVGELQLGGLVIGKGKLSDPARGTELPMLTIQSPNAHDQTDVVVWTDSHGKQAAFDKNGAPSETLKRLAQRATILLPDLYAQGEFTSDGQIIQNQRLVDDKRKYSAFTYGYNDTLVAQRIHDLRTVIAYATLKPNAKIRLYSTNNSSAWAIPAAVATDHEHLNRLLVDTGGFRFADVSDYQHANFVPGAVKYGDIPLLLSICGSRAMVVGEDANSVAAINEMAEGMFDTLPIGSMESAKSNQAIDWLLK